MSIKKTITGLTLSMLLASGVVIAADFNKGIKAYSSGDFKTALAEWTPLAEQGDAATQYFLGVIYFKGKGVPENDKTALMWYTLAAEQGHTVAQYTLGIIYQNGFIGVLENDKTALMWYTLAAKQGEPGAQNNLATLYRDGKGALKDFKRAYMWFNISAFNYDIWAEDNRDSLAKQMAPADISKAQDMSSVCLESNYTDC